MELLTHTFTTIDLLIGQDIQVSSESFISPEQLFASSIYEEEIVEQKD